MAAKTPRTGGLLSSLGDALQKAHNSVKDETDTPNAGDLPAGIDNGIAELRQCYFGQYQKGENVGKYFFYAAGVVIIPDTHEGIPIKGLRTSIMEPFHDTPLKSRKTVEDHLRWIYTQLRGLGIDTSTISVDSLEAVTAALQESKVKFRFRTYKIPKKTPGEKGYNPKYDGPNTPPSRTLHEWQGMILEDAVPNKTSNTSVEETQDGTATVIDTGEIPEYLERARAGDAEAATALEACAIANGISQMEWDATSDWDEVEGLLSGIAPQEAGETGEKVTIPTVGSRWSIDYVDPKTKKSSEVQVEVTKVEEDEQLVDVFLVKTPRVRLTGLHFSRLKAF